MRDMDLFFLRRELFFVAASDNTAVEELLEKLCRGASILPARDRNARIVGSFAQHNVTHPLSCGTGDRGLAIDSLEIFVFTWLLCSAAEVGGIVEPEFWSRQSHAMTQSDHASMVAVGLWMCQCCSS